MRNKLLICILFLLLREQFIESAQVLVKLENNGYVNIVVAITDKVPESAATIQEIKYMIEKASKTLYVATEERAYIQNVTIVVPSTYTGIYDDPGAANMGSADIIVDAYNPNDPYGYSPYVKHYTECGKPGQFIHYTDQFILNSTINGDYGALESTFVHEWAHYRYGVFDEAPQLDDNGNFVFSKNDIKQYCMEWDLIKWNGNMVPDINADKPASLMAFTSNAVITKFCGSNSKRKHNKRATNNQNSQCREESVWETIIKHKDFANGTNPPVNLQDPELKPSITVVKQLPKRVVFVLDVSGSMDERVGNSTVSKMKLLRQAATQLVEDEDVMPNNVHIGIAKFESSASSVVAMRQITTAADRQALVDGIKTLRARGGTSIGAGLRTGIQMIEAYNQSVSGAELMVLTDGEENELPWISHARLDVLRKKVVVHSILYTTATNPKNHELSQLADETNGKDQYVSGNDQSGLIDAFRQVFECDKLKPGEICSNASQLVQSPVRLDPLGSYNGSFTVDFTVGSNTAIRVTFEPNTTANLAITAQSPSGTNYSRSNAAYSEDFTLGTAELTIPDIAEEGKWKYEIRNMRNAARQVQVYVKSGPRNSSVEPVSITVTTSSANVDHDDEESRYLRVYADVRQGPSPILGADVGALVTDKTGLVHRVKLYDTGAGADVNRHDGVYSGYFMNYTSDGAYTFSADVTTNNNSRIKTKGSYGVFPMGAIEKGNFDILKPEYKEAPQMTRQQKGSNYVTVVNPPQIPPIDLAPPARIVDLAVQAVNHDIKMHSLTFTAVGDDMDIGTATQYDMRYAYDSDDLKNNFSECAQIQDHHVLSGSNLSSPRPSGETENFLLDMSSISYNQSVFYAVKAIDKVNKTGDLSNTPSVRFNRALGSSTTPKLTTTTTAPTTTTPEVDKKPASGDGYSSALVAVSVSVVAVVVVVVIAVACVFCYKQKLAFREKRRQFDRPMTTVNIHADSISTYNANANAHANPAYKTDGEEELHVGGLEQRSRSDPNDYFSFPGGQIHTNN